MEGIGGKKGKPVPVPASSSSSISNQLFGPKGGSNSVSPSSKPNSSTGIFDSVFSHPSTHSRSEVVGSWRKNDSENQGWSSNQQNGGNASQTSESQGQSGYNKGRSSIFQDDKAEPHYLSSSLYYGGQDVYSNSSDTHTRSSVKPQTYKEDGEDDDPHGSNLHSASRGNWWQGGLYY